MKNCVYRFLNKDNEVIYIGKASELNSRLNSHNHLPKQCYKETVNIEFIQFETEYEMDLAERYYIPKFNPKYNTVFKDKSINISILEFDNKEWKQFIKEEKKKEIRSLKRNINNENNRLKDEIKLYIIQKEYEHNINIDFNIDDIDVNFETFREIYNHIDNIIKQKIEEKNYYNYNSRKVMCRGTGEIFNNLREYKECMSTYHSLEKLRKVANEESNELLCMYHPNYFECFSRPIYLDIFEGYDIETQKGIIESIKEDTRSIICLTTGQVYQNKRHAQHDTRISCYRVICCCNDQSNYAGVLDNKPLVWKWYDEYLNMTQENIDKYINKAYELYHKRNKSI